VCSISTLKSGSWNNGLDPKRYAIKKEPVRRNRLMGWDRGSWEPSYSVLCKHVEIFFFLPDNERALEGMIRFSQACMLSSHYRVILPFSSKEFTDF
jgi:hypothetical protein